jgi:hypothetical protein
MLRSQFQRVYNPETGRIEYQKYDGGRFFSNIDEVGPALANANGITGAGHSPIHGNGKSDEKIRPENIGKSIISGLQGLQKVNVSKDDDIKERIKKLMIGNGLQISK